LNDAITERGVWADDDVLADRQSFPTREPFITGEACRIDVPFPRTTPGSMNADSWAK
jgi:hypothetical protein